MDRWGLGSEGARPDWMSGRGRRGSLPLAPPWETSQVPEAHETDRKAGLAGSDAAKRGRMAAQARKGPDQRGDWGFGGGGE